MNVPIGSYLSVNISNILSTSEPNFGTLVARLIKIFTDEVSVLRNSYEVTITSYFGYFYYYKSC